MTRIPTGSYAVGLGLSNVCVIREDALADLVAYLPEQDPLHIIQNSEHVYRIANDGRLLDVNSMAKS